MQCGQVGTNPIDPSANDLTGDLLPGCFLKAADVPYKKESITGETKDEEGHQRNAEIFLRLDSVMLKTGMGVRVSLLLLYLMLPGNSKQSQGNISAQSSKELQVFSIVNKSWISAHAGVHLALRLVSNRTDLLPGYKLAVTTSTVDPVSC